MAVNYRVEGSIPSHPSIAVFGNRRAQKPRGFLIHLPKKLMYSQKKKLREQIWNGQRQNPRQDPRGRLAPTAKPGGIRSNGQFWCAY